MEEGSGVEKDLNEAGAHGAVIFAFPEDMYRIEEAVRALLDNTPIKQIARRQKISRNILN